MNLHVLRNTSGWPIERTARVSLSYLAILGIGILILFAFRGLATWLPAQMVG